MNQLHDDGTMTINVDGVPQRRAYSVERGRGRSHFPLQPKPDLKDGERLLEYIGQDSEIITEYGRDP